MDSIQNLAREKAQELKQRENTIRIIGADPMSKKGFTQVPNFILQNDKLSIGAKLTYAMMLKYAWDDDHCFPGQKTLAKDIGTSDRSVRSYLKELEKAGFISIKQRGLGKVNLYDLHLRVKKKK